MKIVFPSIRYLVPGRRVFTRHHLAAAALLVLPSLVHADTTWLEAVIDDVGELAYLTAPFLVGLSTLLFLWGLLSFILGADDENTRTEGRNKMVWGVVALFLSLSVWGVVVLLQNLTGVRGATVTAPEVNTDGIF